MSPKRKRHRGAGSAPREKEHSGVGEGSPAQRFAAFHEHMRAASSQRAEWVRGLSFAPDDFQIRALDAVEAGNSVLVAAPTGAGKTIVGQFGAHMAVRRGMRAFYTTPIKALSNQKYAELRDIFGEENVGLATGDTSVNSSAPIVVMTTEVLRNMMYAGVPLDELALVVLDEVHYLADRLRGPVWEEVIIHLPAHVQIIALSATVSNAEEFGSWIREVRSSCEIIVSERRPVPLYQHMLVGEEILDLYAPGSTRTLNPQLRAAVGDRGMRGGRGSRSWNRAVPLRRESRPSTLISLDRAGLLPAITFIFSRAGCEDAVRQIMSTRITLTTGAQAREIEEYIEETLALMAPEDRHVLGVEEWKRALMRGVAAHHAGMLPLMKETVEHLFSRGLVKMVYATETLALGINMPARTVLIESLTKWNGSSHEQLSAGEYTQLSGRAGRRGIDTEGHAVVSHRGSVAPEEVAALASKRTYPLISAFHPTYNMVVNLLAHSTRARTRELLESSFAQYQADTAVVHLAQRLTSLESERDKTGELLECSHGDVREYIALRDALNQAEKSGARARRGRVKDNAARTLDKVRPGDILAFLRSRSTSYCVVGASERTASGQAHAWVITWDGAWKSLSPQDMRSEIHVVGHMRIPGGSALRRTKERNRIAGELRSMARSGALESVSFEALPDDDVARLRTHMRAHPVHRCPHREDHARAGAAWARIDRDVKKLRATIDRQTGSVAKQFDRVCAVLERLGFLEGDQVSVQGHQLRRLFGERDLAVALSVAQGAWSHLSEAELAAMVSALVYESRSDEDRTELVPAGLTVSLRTAWEECLGVMARIHRVEKACGVAETLPMDGGLMSATLAWAHGSSLATALEGTQIAAGDFVRWMRQVMDALGQIAAASEGTPLCRIAEGAKRRLGRGIVEWSTL